MDFWHFPQDSTNDERLIGTKCSCPPSGDRLGHLRSWIQQSRQHCRGTMMMRANATRDAETCRYTGHFSARLRSDVISSRCVSSS
eukprot:4260424-Amphidinium_carterae.1